MLLRSDGHKQPRQAGKGVRYQEKQDTKGREASPDQDQQ
jgi:hypothetical protein